MEFLQTMGKTRKAKYERELPLKQAEDEWTDSEDDRANASDDNEPDGDEFALPGDDDIA